MEIKNVIKRELSLTLIETIIVLIIIIFIGIYIGRKTSILSNKKSDFFHFLPHLHSFRAEMNIK